MEVLVSLVTYAIGYAISAITGRMSDLLEASQTGRIFNLIQKTSIRNVANTKDGIAVKSVVKNTMIRSIRPLRYRAAKDPRIIPKNTASTAAERPSLADTLKHDMSVPPMSRPVFSETPKSPRKRLRRYRINCTGTGLSKL